MISPIDIFAPRENGLPDLSKISLGQIFHGSIAQNMQRVEQKYDITPTSQADTGVPESSKYNTTIDPKTGKRVVVPLSYLLSPAAKTDASQSVATYAASDHPYRHSPGGGGTDNSVLGPQAPPPDVLDNPGPGENTLLPPPPDNVGDKPPNLNTLPPDVLDALKALGLYPKN